MTPGADSPGVLALVVGPSGAGKDSLLRHARHALCEDGRFVFVRRTVTRASDPEHEDVESVSDREFAVREIAGAFTLSWHAHGLGYGLPRAVVEPALAAGRCVVANASRGIIERARQGRHSVAVILITADPAILARRLAARGREAAADIAQRLARAEMLSDEIVAATIRNDGSLDEAGRRFCDALKGLLEAPAAGRHEIVPAS